MNRNKKKRESYSLDDNNNIYKRCLNEIIDLVDEKSYILNIDTTKSILLDKGVNITSYSVKVRGGYIEVSARYYENKKLKQKSIGRYLLGITDKKLVIDHINNNPLDNRISNLRVCTQSDNLSNRGRFSKLNKYKGYSVSKNIIKIECQKNKTRNSIRINSSDEKCAAIIYDCLSLSMQGEYASLNFPDFNYTPEFISGILNKYEIKSKIIV